MAAYFRLDRLLLDELTSCGEVPTSNTSWMAFRKQWKLYSIKPKKERITHLNVKYRVQSPVCIGIVLHEDLQYFVIIAEIMSVICKVKKSTTNYLQYSTKHSGHVIILRWIFECSHRASVDLNELQMCIYAGNTCRKWEKQLLTVSLTRPLEKTHSQHLKRWCYAETWLHVWGMMSREMISFVYDKKINATSLHRSLICVQNVKLRPTAG